MTTKSEKAFGVQDAVRGKAASTAYEGGVALGLSKRREGGMGRERPDGGKARECAREHSEDRRLGHRFKPFQLPDSKFRVRRVGWAIWEQYR